MAVSRPVLLALLGAVLLVATFTATRSASTSGDAAPAAEAPAPPKPAVTKPSGKDEAAAKPSTTAAERAKADKPVAKKAASSRTGSSNGLPLGVARAFARKDVVVLLFSQSGADDAATRASVRALRGEKGVAVFIEDLKRLGAYRRVVSGLDIAAAPTVVVVDADRKARVLEGFVDEGSLRQHVRDVR